MSSAALAPRCPHFGTCGGCTVLDRPYPDQLQAKVQRLEDALRSAGVDLSVAFDPPRDAPRNHRTKLLYPAQPSSGKGKPLALGLYRRGSHDLIRIRRCSVQDPCLTKIALIAEALCAEAGLRAWDETREKGFLRAFFARYMPSTRELLLGLVTAAGTWPEGRDLAGRLQAEAATLRDARGRRVRCVGVLRNINDRPGNALLGPRWVPLCGRDYVIDRAGALSFRVSAGSFYQVHRGARRLLYEPALDLLGDVRGATVLDAYGGVGCFGLRLAAAGAQRVLSVENSASACRDARAAAKTNRLALEVQESDLQTAELPSRVDVVVVDPPRKGLGDDLERITALGADRLLYTACGEAAFHRDLLRLRDLGYHPRRLALADLFPHTDHGEILALFTR